jgi:hypothetical protein
MCLLILRLAGCHVVAEVSARHESVLVFRFLDLVGVAERDVNRCPAVVEDDVSEVMQLPPGVQVILHDSADGLKQDFLRVIVNVHGCFYKGSY